MAMTFNKGMARRLVGATAALLVAFGVVGTKDAEAQVGLTKHNLSYSLSGTGSSNQSARVNYSTDSSVTQICVFCHTPHGAASAKAPLWQRQIGVGGDETKVDLASYKTYSSVSGSISTTMDGTPAAVGSVSLACLSCHDGTQAINTLANYPGSGSKAFDPTKWSVDANTTMESNGKFKAGAAVNLGSDLQNDHPIGIPYGGGLDATSSSGTKDTAFVNLTSITGGINGTPAWYVEASNNSGRDKNDIALYSRTASGTTTPYVECSSCHDPHMNAQLFLRVSPDNSKICLACHIK